MTKNAAVLKWLEEMKALVKPDEVVWIDGSKNRPRNFVKRLVKQVN